MEKSMEPVRTRGEMEKSIQGSDPDFESDEAWEAMFAAVQADARAFSARAGTLSGGEEAVLGALDAYMEIARRTEALYTYAMMRQNEDSTVGRYQAMYSRAATLANEVSAQSAFLTPELTALPDGVLEKMMQSPAFADYDAFLKGVLRMKPHTLSAREEQLLAMASEVANVPDQAYEMLAGADLDLGRTRGENGEKVPLTDAGFCSAFKPAARRTPECIWEHHGRIRADGQYVRRAVRPGRSRPICLPPGRAAMRAHARRPFIRMRLRRPCMTA